MKSSDPADVLAAAAPAPRRRLLGPDDFPPLAPVAAAAAPLAVAPVAAHAGVAAALFGGLPLP